MENITSESKSVLCTLLDKNDQSKYVFFTQKKPEGGINIGFTNGEGVWKTHLSEENLSPLMKTFSLKSTEDYTLKLKCACKTGKAFVEVQEDSAVLHLGLEPTDSSLTLSKLTDSEGRTEVKDLLFIMADSLTQQDNREFEVRNQLKGPSIAVRKRLPGDSLINPGTRRKKTATGVAFDEDD
ncbi:protein PAXX isoform X2 [Triplophysa dalaica]|uniref:protein PAXX isoform X2 n=1 Tax=Triplophysa dalaica TaxID=1582913 RepID=UPI0024DFC753|nr:protein PAXX isoform X2 [Triplophysa dalaica]